MRIWLCHRFDFLTRIWRGCARELWQNGLAQVLAGLSSKEFSRCAAQYPMVRDTPALSAYDHFATIFFAQLTYRESLRDIEVCLAPDWST